MYEHIRSEVNQTEFEVNQKQRTQFRAKAPLLLH